jgi:hypothetical protein
MDRALAVLDHKPVPGRGGEDRVLAPYFMDILDSTKEGARLTSLTFDLRLFSFPNFFAFSDLSFSSNFLKTFSKTQSSWEK